MAGILKTTSITAPGFFGLNTQESSVNLESGYATIANNCVIDKYGRLGARKGWTTVTTNNGDLADTEAIESIFEFKEVTGTIQYLSSGGGKLFSGTTTLTTKLVYGPDSGGPVALSTQPTFTGNRWQWAALPEGSGAAAESYAFASQIGNTLMVYREGGHTGPFVFQRVGTDYGTKPSGVSTFDPDCCLAAFGRMWVANLTTTKATVFYSQLLNGATFTGTGSGLLDVSAVVGNNDEIVALGVHNNYLVIFLKNNIVVYSGAANPDTMVLADVIKGVGCIARDSVQNTGTDLIFLSKTGVRSLNRTIQENSMPLRELSLNIRDDLVGYLDLETNLSNIKSAYFERDALYLLTFPSSKLMVYFDLRNILQNGAARTSIWINTSTIPYTAFCSTNDRQLYLGLPGKIGKYDGYLDGTDTYTFKYYTTNTDLGEATSNKMLKKADILVIGSGDQPFVFKYGYDYTLNPYSITAVKNLGSATFSKYNTTAKYNVSKYASAGIGVKSISLPLSGSGKVLQFGIEATINNNALSIQKIDLYLQTGKIL